jgi:hypothetical protein
MTARIIRPKASKFAKARWPEQIAICKAGMK